MASDVAIVAPVPGTDVRDQHDKVVLKNIVWLFVHGYHVDANREVIVDPSGDGGFAIQLLADRGLTPATEPGSYIFDP